MESDDPYGLSTSLWRIQSNVLEDKYVTSLIDNVFIYSTVEPLYYGRCWDRSKAQSVLVKAVSSFQSWFVY